MASKRVKHIEIPASVASWVLLNIDLMQTKNLQEARKLQRVADTLEDSFDNKVVQRIQREYDEKVADARAAKEEGEETEEDIALLSTPRADWFKQLYAEIDAKVGAVKISIEEESIDYAATRLGEQAFDGIGRRLLVRFADAVDNATSEMVK